VNDYLERNERFVERERAFISTASHELRTPIAVITGAAELALEQPGLPPRARQQLLRVCSTASSMEQLIQLMLVLARLRGRNPRKVLEVHDLRLDLATLEVQRGGQLLHLYPACRKLLEVLMRASPAAVPRDQLEYALWGDEPPDGDMLRSHIYELRRSVDGPFQDKLLHTLPRVGYRLCAPDASPLAGAPGNGER
jgi:signal transduction histidine kinase